MRKHQHKEHKNINPKGAKFSHIFQGFIDFDSTSFLFVGGGFLPKVTLVVAYNLKA